MNQPTNPTPTDRQTEQAWRILLRLLWLMVILLGSGLVWIYTSFSQLSSKVNDKLAKIDTVDTRLNDMDDRLFALTSLYGQNPNQSTQTSPTKDQDIIKIQLLLVNELYKKGDYANTLTALQAISLQLDQTKGLSASIKGALKNSLSQDIAKLNALKNQPDAWQSHIIKMQDLQAYLRNQQNTSGGTLNQGDVFLNDTILLMSLAIGSANARDRNLMTSYLQDAKSQFEAHLRYKGHSLQFNPTPEELSPASITNMTGALYWFNELLANSPKSENLQSTQILR